MRLIVPIKYSRYGGVERVLICLLSELARQVERVILIVSPKQLEYFRPQLPECESLVYEVSRLPATLPQSKISAVFSKGQPSLRNLILSNYTASSANITKIIATKRCYATSSTNIKPPTASTALPIGLCRLALRSP
ncbi:MAG: hypothetical protein HC890_01420 [Chloroflexaceae bacterium]|nr:hypothetical protein [Chloroflexaceae bacterium]